MVLSCLTPLMPSLTLNSPYNTAGELAGLIAYCGDPIGYDTPNGVVWSHVKQWQRDGLQTQDGAFIPWGATVHLPDYQRHGALKYRVGGWREYLDGEPIDPIPVGNLNDGVPTTAAIIGQHLTPRPAIAIGAFPIA